MLEYLVRRWGWSQPLPPLGLEDSDLNSHSKEPTKDSRGSESSPGGFCWSSLLESWQGGGKRGKRRLGLKKNVLKKEEKSNREADFGSQLNLFSWQTNTQTQNNNKPVNKDEDMLWERSDECLRHLRNYSCCSKTEKSFEHGKCLDTGKTAKSLWIRKVSWNRETAKSFEYRKCLETAKMAKKNEYGKCLETAKEAKSFE